MDGERIGDRSGADNDGENDKAGAANWVNGVSGTEKEATGAIGIEVRI